MFSQQRKKRRCLPLVLVLLFIASPLFASEGDTKEGVFVLPKDAGQSLQNYVPIPSRMKELNVKSLKIDKRYAVLCGDRLGERWCCKLVHPSTITEQSQTNAFAIVSENVREPCFQSAEAALAKKLASAPIENFWKYIRVEAQSNEAPPETKQNRLADRLAAVADSLVRKGEADFAEELLDIAEQLLGDEASLGVWTKPLIHALKGEFDKAKKSAEALPVDEKTKWRRLWAKALISLMEGKVDQTLNWLARPEMLAGDHQCELADIYSIMISSGKRALAYEMVVKAARRFPTCNELVQSGVNELRARGELKKAHKFLEDIAKARKNDPFVIIEQGHTFRADKRYKDALTTWEKAYAIKPDPSLHFYYSTVASQANDADFIDTDDIFEDIQRKYEKNPDNHLFAHAYAILSYYHDDFETSRDLTGELLKVYPDDERLIIYHAMSNYELGHWDEAKAWLDKLESLDTVDPDLHYCRAVLWNEKDPKLALEHLERYLAKPLLAVSSPQKRIRAIKYKERLLKGEPVPDWRPAVDKGFSTLMLFLILALALSGGIFAFFFFNKRRRKG